MNAPQNLTNDPAATEECTPAIPTTPGTEPAGHVRGDLVEFEDSAYIVLGRDTEQPAHYALLRENDLAFLTLDQDELFNFLGTLTPRAVDVTERAARTAERTQKSLEAFKVRTREVASEYAEQHDWCSVVSDALGELGLPGVEQDYETTLTVQLSFTVTVEATSEENAEGKMTTQFAVDRVYALNREDLYEAIDHVEATEWEVN